MNQIHFSESAIKMSVTTFKWMANDIYQIYIPSLKLSSYGPTSEAAAEMMNFSMKEFICDLEAIDKENIESALSNLGWKSDTSKSEIFSHSYVDKYDVTEQLELEDVELIEEIISVNY